MPTVRDRFRRTLARAALVGACLIAGMSGLAVGAPAASAATPTIDCDTVAQPSAAWTSCQQLTGTIDCVWNNKDGTWTMAVGYKNPTADDLFASIPPAPDGTNNTFTATDGFAANPDHISWFWPGTSVTAFTVTWTPASKTDPVVWTLMGHTYSWTETSAAACPKTPVPMVGSIAGAFGALVLLMGGFGIANYRATARYRVPGGLRWWQRGQRQLA